VKYYFEFFFDSDKWLRDWLYYLPLIFLGIVKYGCQVIKFTLENVW
jgi:hypothetical protein